MLCAKCGAATAPGDNRLLIAFGGGYGDFIDRVPPQGPIESALCGLCAHALLIDEPWLVPVLGLRRSRDDDPENPIGSIAGHNTGCFCWKGSEGFQEAIATQGRR